MLTKQLVFYFTLIFHLARAVAKQDDELPVVVFYDPVNRSRNMSQVRPFHPVKSEYQGIRDRTNRQERSKSENTQSIVDDPPTIGIRDRTNKQERSKSENTPLATVEEAQTIGIRDRANKHERTMSENAPPLAIVEDPQAIGIRDRTYQQERLNSENIQSKVEDPQSIGIRDRTSNQEQTNSESALPIVGDPKNIGIRDRTIKQEWSKSENAPPIVEDPQIIGGTAAKAGEYPYFSSIISSSKWLCGASLVAPDILISAAHCADAFKEGAIVGATNVAQVTSGSEKVKVVKKVIHPNSAHNDIMLIKISPAVTKMKYVQINFDPALPAHVEPLEIVGFGQTSNSGPISHTLQQAHVKELPFRKCVKQRFYGLDASIHICVWNNKPFRSSCYGDSGGPLLGFGRGSTSNTMLTYGVLSFGHSKCTDGPSVYIRLSGYASYLRSTMCSLSSNPPAYLGYNKN